MKRSLLALSIFASLPAHAIYNLYNVDGTTFDINGEVSIQLVQKADKVKYLAPGAYFDGSLQDKIVTEARTDKRVRLGQDTGASWIEFRGAKKMNKGLRATGVVGLGFDEVLRKGYLDTTYLAIDKQDMGAVSVGRQFLHTGYIPRTGTFNSLDSFGAQSARADYTGIKGLHVSAYYNFPENSNKDPSNDLWTKAYGVSASYIQPFANNTSLRIGAGATTHDANPRNTTTYPVNKKGALGSVEYRMGRYLAAVDFGSEVDTHSDKKQLQRERTAQFVGAKVGMELTPQWTVAAGLGHQKIEVEFDDKAKGQTPDSVLDLMKNNKVDLYDTAERTRAHVRADYYMRESVRFYGRADFESSVHRLFGKEYIKREQPEYRVGVTLSF